MRVLEEEVFAHHSLSRLRLGGTVATPQRGFSLAMAHALHGVATRGAWADSNSTHDASNYRLTLRAVGCREIGLEFSRRRDGRLVCV
jgi:hypothetical protein